MKIGVILPRIGSRRLGAGFTVIELIGVLSIVSLLTLVVVESVLKRVRQAQRAGEAGTVRAMADAFKAAVVRTRSFPVVTNALPLIGRELAVPTSQVLVNPQGRTRAIVYDPNINFGGGSVPPYTQGVHGATAVNQLRVMLVSSLTDELPSLSGSTMFDALWATAPGTLPAGWPSSWSGNGSDLLIERVDLRPQFCRLHLNNLDQTLIGRYAVDSTNQSSTVSVSSCRSGWYLVGTSLILFSSDGAIQVNEVLVDDASYVYENGRWGRYLVSGKTKPPGTFGSLVDQFLSTSPPPPDSNQFGANQQAIVDEMYYYMWAYAQWASAGFPKGGSSSSQHVPELRFISDSSVRLSQVAGNLLKK